MKDEVPFSDFPAYTEKSSSKFKALGILLIVILLIGGVVGGLYFLGRNNNSDSNIVNTPTDFPVPTESALPTATPAKDLERSDLEVSVLNGSGVAGAANSTAAKLRSLGYEVVSTGNADKFDYTGLSVKVKKESQDFMDLLEKDLTASASAASVSASVDDSISTDAQVIVGK